VRQFTISAARAGRLPALERAVATRFCARAGCGAPAAAGAAPAVARAVPAASPDDGLSCIPASGPHGHLHARACARVLAELRALAAALAATARAGTAIDWRVLAPARGRRLVVVNAAGASVALAGDALARAPELVLRARPWLEARVKGRRSVLALAPPASIVYAAR
jgi:hypothetical protein